VDVGIAVSNTDSARTINEICESSSYKTKKTYGPRHEKPVLSHFEQFYLDLVSLISEHIVKRIVGLAVAEIFASNIA
jgi:hypothetical protein